MPKTTKKTLLMLMVFSTALTGAIAAKTEKRPVSYLPWYAAENIDDDWLYLEDNPPGMPEVAQDSDYTPVTLPHTWNAKDSLHTRNYRRGISWYRHYLNITEQDLSNRLYLRFGAAGQQAELYINGKHVLDHKGGYTAFACEITKLVTPGRNRIDVKVSNAFDETIPPHTADYTFYGGLYRQVFLLRGPRTGISRQQYAGPGIKVWSKNISEQQADLLTQVALDTGAQKQQEIGITVELIAPDGTLSGSATKTAVVSPGKPKNVELPVVTVKSPLLWSPDHPNLYTVNVAIHDQRGNIIDQAQVHYGFRWYKFTADRGFFLNGKPYKLNGVNRHQDLYGYGNALSVEQHTRDIKAIKAVGANWLRLAHYTQHDAVLDLCDELGILVWEENPWVNDTSYRPEFLQNMRSMMTEMINQHFNHPAIVVWGMANEVHLQKGAQGKARQLPLYKSMNTLVHTLDPTRVSGVVSGNTSSYAKLGVVDIPDVMGYNLYNGWYGGHLDGFSRRANQLHRMNPDKPMVITEYGAGSDTRIHSLTPRMQDFSEEWQVKFFESYQKQAANLPWLSGMTWWAFADFGSAGRGNSIPHVNQKGMLTFDRRKKDLYFVAQARWTDTPVLHIQSAAWTNRHGETVWPIRVITNLQKVELALNGQSLGSQTNRFVWQVRFTPGTNSLVASGRADNGETLRHEITVTWQKSALRYKVTATATQKENPAGNMADGKDYTRWSCQGKATVNIDLGHPVLLDGLAFHFYQGNQRRYKLRISLSLDNKAFATAFDGTSNRHEKEKIMFEQAEVRYIRVDVDGSDVSNWTSWYELKPIIATKKKKKNRYEKIGAGEE